LFGGEAFGDQYVLFEQCEVHLFPLLLSTRA
jgi:hypothetical protein